VTVARLYELAPAHQFAASWQNFDGSQTIYITDDPSLNSITIELTNGLGTPVALPAGKPAPYGELAPGQSAVYLFFSGIVTSDQLEGAQLSATGWSTSVYEQQDGSGLEYLVIAPDADVTLAGGDRLDFQLTRLLASPSTTSGTVTLMIAGASGITPDQAEIPVYVHVGNPPDPDKKALDLIVGFAQRDEVFTGPGQDNELVLAITNPGKTPLVPGGAKAWDADPPTFQLTLVFGNGRGALTTVDAGNAIRVNLGDTYGNVWKDADPKPLGDATYWVLQPDRNGGGTVLGAHENATVTVKLSNIVTTLPQGVTLAYLSYSHVPGYNDGFFACEILKVDPIVVESFSATPSVVTGATGPTPVRLDFDVQNASYVTIVNAGYAAPATSADFADHVTVEIDRAMQFMLLLANFKTGQHLSVPLDVGFESAPVTITSFDARPNPVSTLPGSSPKVTLRLQVSGATDVAIAEAAWSSKADPAGFRDEVDVLVHSTTAFTLLATNSATGRQAVASCTARAVPDPSTLRTLSGRVAYITSGALDQPGHGALYSLSEFHPGEIQVTVEPGVFTSSPRFGLSVLPVETGGPTPSVGVFEGSVEDPDNPGGYLFFVSIRSVADNTPVRAPFGFTITQTL
jgi:hypothetical protein